MFDFDKISALMVKDMMDENKSYQYVVPETLTRDYEVTPRDLLAGLKQTTSSHGMPHVARAGGEMKRNLVLLFCTCFNCSIDIGHMFIQRRGNASCEDKQQ